MILISPHYRLTSDVCNINITLLVRYVIPNVTFVIAVEIRTHIHTKHARTLPNDLEAMLLYVPHYEVRKSVCRIFRSKRILTGEFIFQLAINSL